ncbi:hypothetical protein TsFJ059_006482 [Trichoderma semiorbis]|uniref:Uncharacterized protein n=1 Tax=Trichoderma semiorbis TaxID=1491008 RepID=A0A9P8KQM3_9HYPO|nr:hypothetical protein TsFJ059_006482 [Trichoderma semiorbis]
MIRLLEAGAVRRNGHKNRQERGRTAKPWGLKVGHGATGIPVWKVTEAGQHKPEGYNRTQVRRGGQGFLRVSHSKRNASREENLSVGSNQNGSAYEKLARMDEGLKVEVNGLDDDGDDTDSDESRGVSSQLRPRSCSSRLRSRLLVSASKTPRTKNDLVEKRRS